MAIVSSGVIATARISAIAEPKQAMRQPGVGYCRTASTYRTRKSGTSTNASGCHDHRYGSTALR